jgi:hypothetical protein
VNPLVSRFLRDKLRVIPPALEASRFLSQHREAAKPRVGFLTSPLLTQPGR